MNNKYDAINFINDLNVMLKEIEDMKQQLQAYKDKEDKLRKIIKEKHKNCVENIENEVTFNSTVIYNNGKIDVYAALLQMLDGSDTNESK